MSIEDKQNYLRTEIIERGISTDDFFEYWQTLDLQLDDVDMEKLKQVVTHFLENIRIVDKGEDKEIQKEGEANEEQEEEFTDFQEAQPQEEVKVEIKPQYADFNWDFLNIKKKQEQSHPVPQTSFASNDSPNKLEIESTPPKRQTKRPISKPLTKPENKPKGRQLTTRTVMEPQKPKKKSPNLIDQLVQQQVVNSNHLPENGRPSEQKSVTVKQVLQSSKLNRLKCLKLQENVLSHHTNVEIIITNVEEVEDKNANIINKLIKKTELLYTIKTVARNKNRSIGISWEVKRKTKDFEWLRNILMKFYPGLVVPPLPAPTSSKEKIYGYQKKLEHFLLDCYRCPQLKNSTYYENFLSYSNPSDFESFVKKANTASKPKSLSHIINMTGVIETLYSESIEKYGLGLQNYITKTTNHLKQVNQILNEINEAYDNISQSYKQLASLFFQMADQSHQFSNQVCYQRLASTYKQVAILTEEHSTFCEIEKDFIDAFMKSHFAYQKIRLENMQGLINKRTTFANQLAKCPKEEGKGMFGKLTSIFGQKAQYVDTPSSNYETLTNQVGYYNNQLLQESVRCVQVMIDSHVNHFAGYGHSRIDNVDKMQKIWSNQMVELSKLALAK